MQPAKSSSSPSSVFFVQGKMPAIGIPSANTALLVIGILATSAVLWIQISHDAHAIAATRLRGQELQHERPIHADDLDRAQRRLELSSKDCGSVSDASRNYSTFVIANSAQVHLLDEWVQNAQTKKVLNYKVIALDKRIAAHCAEKNWPHIYNASLDIPGGDEDMAFKSKSFMRIGLFKFAWIARLLADDITFLMTELDIFIAKNPFDCTGFSTNVDEYTCVGKHAAFDIEIQPNMIPRATVQRGTELNIGFMFFRPTRATKRLVSDVIAAIRETNDWDQKVFSTLAWRDQCAFADDNAGRAPSYVGAELHGTLCCDGLKLRVLPVWYFPTGGRESQTGVVDTQKYIDNPPGPTVLHCTGRTGLRAKHNCLKKAKLAYNDPWNVKFEMEKQR